MGYGGPQWNGVTPPESPVSKGKSQSDHVGAGHVGAPYFDGSGQYGMGDGYGNGGVGEVAEELETKRGGGIALGNTLYVPGTAAGAAPQFTPGCGSACKGDPTLSCWQKHGAGYDGGSTIGGEVSVDTTIGWAGGGAGDVVKGGVVGRDVKGT